MMRMKFVILLLVLLWCDCVLETKANMNINVDYWPTCEQLANTQYYMNYKDDRGLRLFDPPTFSYTEELIFFAYPANCCADKFRGKVVNTVMASPRAAIRYYSEIYSDIIGTFQIPFYFYNATQRKFKLALWDSKNSDAYQLEITFGSYFNVPFLAGVNEPRKLGLSTPVMSTYWNPASPGMPDYPYKAIYYNVDPYYLEKLVERNEVYATTPECACGYTGVINIHKSDEECTDCYKGFKGEIQCVDIDECKEATENLCSFRPNSHCVNTLGSFQCVCDSGYYTKKSSCIFVRNAIETIVWANTATSVVFTVEGSSRLPNPAWSYSYNITDWSNPTYPMPVYGATQVHVSQEQAESVLGFQNLIPGTNYSIDFDVYDENSTRITDVYGFTTDASFQTPCTCGSASDAPKLLDDAITQKNGLIYFKFLGNSMCGNAYTFSRQSVGFNETLSSNTIFTPNYFFTGNECSSTPYEPGKASADILSESKLTVGARYRYNIRAVGAKYMGEVSSKDFVIRWESSISGHVGLKPDLGDLPVENVTVRWALKNETGDTVAQGVTTSSKSGRFEIHPMELIPFENDVDYPMHITFEKFTKINSTYGIKHQFLCNSGHFNCTDTGIVVHIRHLDFNIPLNVIDATSIPVSGNVYVANTKFNPDGTRWSSEDGCAMLNVRICLIDRSPGGDNRELVCTETAGDGSYSLPGVIGTRVSINATYNNHTFEYLPGEYTPNFEDGVVIQPDQLYERNDFQDKSLVPLKLTVAGGICDLELGTATITYRINGCMWLGVQFDQQKLSQVYNMIPANNLVFSVDNIAKRSSIELLPQNLDLTHKVLSDNVTELRFQYDGHAKIQVMFQGDINDGCASIDGVTADSIHVLPFETPTNATFLITRDLGNGLLCDAVDSDARVIIQNNLGILADNPTDDAYAAAIAHSSPKEILQLLYHCNQGCSANITHDYNPTLKRNTRARVEFQFMTGRPNIIEPFIKTLILRTDEVNSVSYTAAVVVVGQYKKGDLYSVGLPTYEPILIIRDPPGGTSYAFYENVQTTIRLKNFKYTEFRGLDTNDKGLLGFKGKTGGCSGIGFMLCQSLYEMQNVAGYHYIGSKLDLEEMYNLVQSRAFTTTWSYKTPSSDPLFTGNITDTFVVPNLNVKFSMIETVSWNQSTCEASSLGETAFNLKSPENVPALAFVTAFEVLNTEIPYLEQNIESTARKIREVKSDNERSQLQEELKALQDAIQGWRDALAKNEEIKQMVLTGNETYQVKPHEWFEKIVSPVIDEENKGYMQKLNLNEIFDISDLEHNSALLPEDLMSSAKIRPFYEGADSSITNLDSTNTIKFSGGGNQFSFSLSNTKMETHIKDLGSRKSSEYHGAYLKLENIVSIVASIGEVDAGERTEEVIDTTQSDQAQTATSIGFSLSDPDAGDQFDVDVYIDPIYGTFIFHTRSGKSICKHEPGTENRAVPQLELVAFPPPVVLEDDLMVFHIKITKMGAGSQGFMLYQDVREDLDAIIHYPLLPRLFPILESEESFTTTITLRRGPEKYEYPAYTIILQPNCEYLALPLLGEDATIAKVELYNQVDPVDQSRKIVFARPCAPIVLKGDIAKTQTFLITADDPEAPVKVVVQNPNSSLMRWANATLDPQTRLKQVQLFYRRLGTVQWEVGQYSTDEGMVNIDFAEPSREDAYGFATVAWDVSQLTDGSYEMQVRTVCDDVAGAPAIFNGQETEVIRGVFDRKPPKLYGLPQPQGKLPFGQPITIEFDEPLDCGLPLKFSVDIRVQGLMKEFDNRNLLVLCEDRTISVQFDRADVGSNELIGRNLTLELVDVVDKNRNLLRTKVVYTVDIVADSEGSKMRQLNEELSNHEMMTLEDFRQDLINEMQRISTELQNQMIDILSRELKRTIPPENK